MSIEKLKDRLPEHAKDLRINLGAIHVVQLFARRTRHTRLEDAAAVEDLLIGRDPMHPLKADYGQHLVEELAGSIR